MARDEVDDILGDEMPDEAEAPPEEAPAPKGALPEGLLVAAEEIMDVLSDGFGFSSPSDSDSKVQKATKQAARRAKAEILAQSLLDFFQIADASPHEEGPHTGEAPVEEEDGGPPFE